MLSSFISVDVQHTGRISDFLIVIVFLLFITLLIQYHWKRRRMYELAEKLPGPPVIPLFGNANMFLGLNNEGMFDAIKELIHDNMSHLTTSPLRLWLGPKLVIVVAKPEDLRILLNSPYALEKSMEFYKFLRPSLGDSLLHKPVSEWKPHRKLFSTAFTKSKCYTFVDEFEKSSQGFVRDVIKESNKGVVDVGHLLDLNIMDIVCKCLMNVTFNDRNEFNRFLVAARRLLEVEFERVCKFWLHYDTIYNWTSLYEEEIRCLKEASYLIDMILEERIEARMNKNNNNSKVSKDSITLEKECLLDLLMNLKDELKFTDRQLRDEMVLFFGAGVDTTSNALHIVLMMLAMHPDVQERLYEEIQCILEYTDRPVEAKDLREMTYLDMVIKESLRMYPIIPVVARKVTKDLKLETFTIPAGSICVPSPFAVHSNPELWPDPHKFDPERFRPGEYKRHTYSFIPFCGGPRNCIGNKFAMIVIKTLVSTVVRALKMTTDGSHADIKMKISVTAKVSNSCRIYFEERETNCTNN